MTSTIVIQHPVADFQTWKKMFDSDPLGRAQNGVTGHSIYRTADSNLVVIHLEFASRQQAEVYLPKLRELWKRVGDKVGFADAGGVQAGIFDQVERVAY